MNECAFLEKPKTHEFIDISKEENKQKRAFGVLEYIRGNVHWVDAKDK